MKPIEMILAYLLNLITPWGYIGVMPKINVYISDELYQNIKKSGINVSAVAQRAFQAACDSTSTNQWLQNFTFAHPKTTHEAVITAIDAAKEEFGQ